LNVDPTPDESHLVLEVNDASMEYEEAVVLLDAKTEESRLVAVEAEMLPSGELQLEPTTVASSPTPVEASSLSLSARESPSAPTMRLEDSIEAIDALEDALEEVTKTIPADTSSPVKTKRAQAAVHANAGNRLSMSVTKSAASPVKPTPRTSSMIKGKPNALSASKSLNRSASVRASTKQPKPTSTDHSSNEGQQEKVKTEDYLAARRRPISLHFPTPPPPPKSTKAPTKSNFQLPGEAVAAKLKAAKEERQKREEEEAAAKKKEPKARTAPKTPAPFNVATKPTAASRARESLIATSARKENSFSSSAGPTSKRNSVASTTSVKPTPSAAAAAEKRLSTFASKRASVAPSRERPDNTAIGTQRPRPSSLYVPKGSTTGSTLAQNRGSLHPSSSSTATMSKPRIPSNISSSASFTTATGPAASQRAVSAAEAVVLKQKAKAIFNRDKVEKERRERERRGKEEGAKRARVQAAERGRVASREWAERQRRRGEAEKAARVGGVVKVESEEKGGEVGVGVEVEQAEVVV